MNTVLLLLATSSVPGADVYAPAPAAPYTYNSGQAAPAQRPRFFGRLRGMFSRRSQNTAPSAPYGNPSYAAPTVSGNTSYLQPGQPAPIVSTTPPQAVPGRLTAQPAPLPAPVLTNEPPLAPPVSAPARQMPVGEPKFE